MRRTSELLLWPILLVIGILVYAITKNVVLGVSLSSLRAAWPVVRSWQVIRAIDPSKQRRRILCLFYVALACWRAAASALISILVFVFLDKKLGHKVDLKQLNAPLLVLFAGIACTTVIGLVAVCWSVIGGQRAWVDPHLYKVVKRWARTKDDKEFARSRVNYAIFIIGTAVSLSFVIPGLVVLSVIDQAGQPLFSIVGCSLLLVALPMTIASCSSLSDRIVARTPEDCWPEGYFSVHETGVDQD